MTRYTLTLQEEHHAVLKKHLFPGHGNERAAYLICGIASIGADPWTLVPEKRYLSREVIPVPESEIISSGPGEITWKTDSYVRALKRAEEIGAVVALIHGHPRGIDYFSKVDDRNEPEFFKIAINRNGFGHPNLSLIMLPEGRLLGRVWDSEMNTCPLEMIRVYGRRFRHHVSEGKVAEPSDIYARQTLAFGAALQNELGAMRVGVVGCGGTGSAVATMLSRLGIGHIALIDKDRTHKTNLNRLHGATMADAEAELLKVKVIERSIKDSGLGTKVITSEHWVGTLAVRDVIKSCDVILGCTDDHSGRLLLNRFANFYLVPVIDIGLAMKVSDESPPKISTLDGRVTTLVPGNTCLICRGTVDPKVAYAEDLKRNDPEEYKKRKAEAYVEGEGDPNPAVITFTTELACMAVNELIHRVQGFRGEYSPAQWIRKFHLNETLKAGQASLEGCPICVSKRYHGRGDVTPFLDVVGYG